MLFQYFANFVELHGKYTHKYMNNKIQELTDIIFSEGVAKGQAQADEIMLKARNEAEALLSQARKEADEIVAAARRQSETDAENVRKELKLYSQQAVASLKSQIANLVTDTITSQAVGSLLSNQDAFNSLVLEIAGQWNGRQAPVISSAQADGLKSFFTAKAKELLDKGLEIRPVAGQDTSFSIQPKDGSYKLNFGQAEFESWMKSMLREQISELLFK